MLLWTLIIYATCIHARLDIHMQKNNLLLELKMDTCLHDTTAYVSTPWQIFVLEMIPLNSPTHTLHMHNIH